MRSIRYPGNSARGAADPDGTSAETPLLTTRRRVASSITNREAPAVVPGLAFIQLAGIAPRL